MEALALGVCTRPRGPSLQGLPGGFFIGHNGARRKAYLPWDFATKSRTSRAISGAAYLTDPDQGRHAINILMNDLIAAVARWSGLSADILRRRPVVPITDNYDRLFYEPDAIARSARYSYYSSFLLALSLPPARRR